MIAVFGNGEPRIKRPATDLDPSRLGPNFFKHDARKVAHELIGTYLVCRRADTVLMNKITETEAYVGPHDLACHASRGRTARTEAMFGPPGTFYVYLVYGLHWMLNVVTGPVGYPAAVLIRSLGATAGPGRLTALLGITGVLNGKTADEETGVWFSGHKKFAQLAIIRTRRIGVEYAGPVWSAKKYRFVMKKERQNC
jgi:DNA-3-methyladenine glycosylase